MVEKLHSGQPREVDDRPAHCVLTAYTAYICGVRTEIRTSYPSIARRLRTLPMRSRELSREGNSPASDLLSASNSAQGERLGRAFCRLLSSSKPSLGPASSHRRSAGGVLQHGASWPLCLRQGLAGGGSAKALPRAFSVHLGSPSASRSPGRS